MIIMKKFAMTRLLVGVGRVFPRDTWGPYLRFWVSQNMSLEHLRGGIPKKGDLWWRHPVEYKESWFSRASRP